MIKVIQTNLNVSLSHKYCQNLGSKDPGEIRTSLMILPTVAVKPDIYLQHKSAFSTTIAGNYFEQGTVIWVTVDPQSLSVIPPLEIEFKSWFWLVIQNGSFLSTLSIQNGLSSSHSKSNLQIRFHWPWPIDNIRRDNPSPIVLLYKTSNKLHTEQPGRTIPFASLSNNFTLSDVNSGF